MCIWFEESTNLQWTDHPITIANYQSHDPNHWWFYNNRWWVCLYWLQSKPTTFKVQEHRNYLRREDTHEYVKLDYAECETKTDHSTTAHQCTFL